VDTPLSTVTTRLIIHFVAVRWSVKMAKGMVFCSEFVFVLLVIFCPASVHTDADSFYNMTNEFLDVLQPSTRLSGMNSLNNSIALYVSSNLMTVLIFRH